VNLPAARSLAVRSWTGGDESRQRNVEASPAAGQSRPVRTLVLVAIAVTAISSVLELVNPANSWVFFEDLAGCVAPAVGAVAVAVAARTGEPESRQFRRALTLALGLTAIGQVASDVPDVFQSALTPAFDVAAQVFNVGGAVVVIAALRRSVYERLEAGTSLQSFLDGLIIMAASLTFLIAGWLNQSFNQSGQPAVLFEDAAPRLLGLCASATLVSTCAAVVLGALALRVEPSLHGIWAVVAGMLLVDLAWSLWLVSVLSGGNDGVSPSGLIFPVAALLTAYGAVTWTLKPGGGRHYDFVAGAVSDWLPIAAIVGCAILVVMPHPRPLDVDPIAVGTGVVVLLAVARQRMLQSRERAASGRLTGEISERAAATVALARLEVAPTIEETANRICTEALRLAGIDTVALFAFDSVGVVAIAQAGPQTRPVVAGDRLPAECGRELVERSGSGLWLEPWTSRIPRDEFDRATIASGLQAEALAPLIWNDQPIGLLSMGTTSATHSGRLSDRLATVTEFGVMSAAILGPMLSERRHHEQVRAEVRGVIAERSFTPVFQPIVRLATGRFVGFEALTRFSDGTRPDLRFLAADKVGMMVQLEMATLNMQIEQARFLPARSFVSLNISPALAGCVIPLLDVLAEADREVVLEITEHAEIGDYGRLVEALDQVRPHAMLAVDDAGAGYAGLHHILELRPQYVKLDISLVRNIDSDPARQAMVNSMTRFAESVGCALIAEGIETENELIALKLLNVEFGQGYFLCRPAPIAAFAQAEVAAGQGDLTAIKPKRRRKAA
jgi:EAL domain-containing protein (putative c-di-GMP-specific phosphodiesterase class I)